MKALSAVLLTCLASTCVAADEVRYIRDWISIPLRETQAPDSTVVHRGLVSGNSVTLLENDEKSGLARVRSADGVEGWLANRYLTAEPPARVQLDKANGEIAELRKLNEQLKSQQSPDARQLEELRAENTRLSTELETLKHAPSHAEQLEALRQRNAALGEQFQQLGASLEQAQHSRDTEMFRNGALAVLAGALLSLLASRLWPKKKSEWA